MLGVFEDDGVKSNRDAQSEGRGLGNATRFVRARTEIRLVIDQPRYTPKNFSPNLLSGSSHTKRKHNTAVKAFSTREPAVHVTARGSMTTKTVCASGE